MSDLKKNGIRLWWMNDNHTFVRLRNDTLDDTMQQVLECWERDTWGMLCGYQPKPSDEHLPGQVHGNGRDKRKTFEAEARAWLSLFLPNPAAAKEQRNKQ